MRLLDANFIAGRGLVPARFDTGAPEGALDALDFFEIERALVRTTAQEEWSAADGNRLVLEYCRNSDRLLPVWTLLPALTGEFPPPVEMAETLRAAGVLAVAWNADTRFPLEEPLFSGDLTAALAREGIPLLYPVNGNDELVRVAAVMRRAPNLTLIACINRPAWGLERYLWPLFENCPNLRVATSGYHISGAIQATVEKYGAGRFVFGSGYPYLNPGGAVEFLRRLDIGEEAREAIAWRNLSEILEWNEGAGHENH